MVYLRLHLFLVCLFLLFGSFAFRSKTLLERHTERIQFGLRSYCSCRPFAQRNLFSAISGLLLAFRILDIVFDWSGVVFGLHNQFVSGFSLINHFLWNKHSSNFCGAFLNHGAGSFKKRLLVQ
jgi:hypothetical protein